MRALSTLAVLVVLGASGAVVAARLATADGTGRPAGSAPPAVAGSAVRAAPAPRVISHAEPVRLTVRTGRGRVLLTTTLGAVDPVRGPSGYEPVDPPAWNQAVWVRYRPLVSPTDTTHGTSYVYGHACHHHVCSFTHLAQVRRGGSITVRAGRQVTRYIVTTASAGFPKVGPRSLSHRRSGVADRAIADRIVLITCAYEEGDLSLNNFVVVARRVPDRGSA